MPDRADADPPRRHARVAAALLAVLAALLAAGAGAAYWEANAVVSELSAGEKGPVVDAVREELDVPPARPAVPEPDIPPGRPVTDLELPEPEARTILLLGSDGRWGEEESRADTMALLRVDPDRERIALLSIPRDLYVQIPGYGWDRVNMAYEHGGAALLARTVRETFGVRLDHFVEVDFGGFRRLVGELGGVWLPVDQRYFNRNDGTAARNFASIDLEPGYQRLDGADALAFVRYRHGDSDLLRAARQQLFLRETARQVVERRYDVLAMRRLVHAFAEQTASDIDEIGELWRLVDAIRATPPDRVARFTVPVDDLVLGGAYYLQTTPEQLRRTVERWYGADPSGPEEAAAERPEPDREDAGPRTPAQLPDLAPDGGRAEQLLAGLGVAPACVPTALPQGFWWPAADAARAYELEGHDAIALSATRGSGRSLLWTMTRWDGAPTLAEPTATVERGGRSYELHLEGGRVRQVAWREGETRVWITNTLRNEVSNGELLALAESCVAPGD